MGQKAKRTPLRSNTTVGPDWAQRVYDTSGDLVDEGPTHGGRGTTSSIVRLGTFTSHRRNKKKQEGNFVQMNNFELVLTYNGVSYSCLILSLQ